MTTVPVVTSRLEAIGLGKKTYFTGRPCKRGHTVERYVSSRNCVSCMMASVSAWAEENREQKRRHAREWAKRNKSTGDQWALANPDRRREVARDWVKRNRGAASHSAALYRARKKRATPAWSDIAAIKSIYREARRISVETGIPHEVDHIHPLVSPILCGLHVPHNLQIISARINRLKSNSVFGDG